MNFEQEGVGLFFGFVSCEAVVSLGVEQGRFGCLIDGTATLKCKQEIERYHDGCDDLDRVW
jgi:hypothetical protein